MADYALSRRAARDLADILRYSIGRFGPERAGAYRDSLLQALDVIARHPAIGSDQRYVKPGLRRMVHASHSIYYRRTSTGILVVRLLGPGRDPGRAFPP